MAVYSMFICFAISYFIISDIQCSERITAKTSTVTNSSKKKNIDLLQLINQETLIRFELDKNVHKINSKVESIKIDNKLARDRFNQGMLSINATLSGLRKNQDETNEAVNIVKTNQTSTDSEMDQLKEEIKSFKQKQNIDQKLAKDQFNQEISSINTTLSGLRKNQDETNEAVNIVKTDQTSADSEIGLLKEEIKSFTQKQKLARDQFNQEIQSINTTLSGLRKNQDETNEAVNIVKANQTSTDSLLKEELKSLKQKLLHLEYNQQKLITDLVKDKIENTLLKQEMQSLKASQKELIQNVTGTLKDQVNIPISNIRTSLLRSQQKQAKLSSTQTNIQRKQTQISSAQAILQQKQTTLSSELSALQNNYTSMMQSRKSQISFNAAVSSYKRTLSSGETIIYQNVISNIGNAYNSATGIFTSPQEGTYVFFFSTYPYYSGRSLYLDMVRNSNTVVRGYSYDKDYYDAVSALAVIHLTAGDRVWIRCNSGCDAGIDTMGGSYTSTFSGFML